VKYKFIGTEQDLIDNGYIDDALGVVKPVELNELNEFDACKLINENSKTIYIQISRTLYNESKGLINNPIKVSKCEVSKDLKSVKGCIEIKNIKPYIQDLIDKGLVVEE
jgi:hypothetical protein